MISAETLSRLTAQCIHYVSPGDLEVIWDELIDYDLRVLEVDASAIASEQALLDALSEAAFDPAIKQGWTALFEYLVDGNRANASGVVIVVHMAQELWQSSPAIAGALVEVWLAAAETGLEHDFAAHLVFEVPGARSPLQRVEDAVNDPFIQLQPVQSTMLRSVGYDPRQRILELEFHDRRIYRYYQVPSRIYRELLEAESTGLYFQDAISGVFPYQKVSK